MGNSLGVCYNLSQKVDSIVIKFEKEKNILQNQMYVLIF